MTTHSPALHRARAARNSPRFATFVRENGLSLVLTAMFLASAAGQIGFGLAAYNEERAHAGFTAVSLGSYLTSGHFLEALFENWESEFARSEENLAQGRPPETFGEYWTSSQFWFESFQNWQSEFLAVLAIVVLTIFLRQRGSPQSKPVAAPHDETGV